jgi:hypothetical protein
MGAAILQKTPMGTFSYLYVPNNGSSSISASGTNAVVALSNSEYVNENTTGAYEAGFLGDFGVKGLTVHYFQNKNSDFVTSTNTVQAEGKNYGIKYNFGQFTVAANKKLHQPESVAANSTTAALGEISEKAFAAAYAVNKDLSVGVLYAKASRPANTNGSLVAANDVQANSGTQKLKAINIGYNLGPVALAAAYAKNDNAQGATGADDKQFMLRLIGAF